MDHPMLKHLNKISIYSMLLMLTTAIHHYYAAIIYKTPWRLHAIPLGVGMIVFTLLSLFLIHKWKDHVVSKITRWLLLTVTFVISLGVIGLYEGFYNHFIKIIAYLIGVPESIKIIMFPPNLYVPPDNWINETTGVLQFAIAIMLMKNFYHYFSLKRSEKKEA